MKKVIVKRLVLRNAYEPDIIGGREFFGTLPDQSILDSIHEVGKTQWIGSNLWLLQNGSPVYRIDVESFVQYQKSWFDLLIDAVRRI